MPLSMDESSSSAPTPEPLERKMTRSLLALSNDEMTIPKQLAAIAPQDRGLGTARIGATSSSGAGARRCNDFLRLVEPWLEASDSDNAPVGTRE